MGSALDRHSRAESVTLVLIGVLNSVTTSIVEALTAFRGRGIRDDQVDGCLTDPIFRNLVRDPFDGIVGTSQPA
jgi:hypothetical protein